MAQTPITPPSSATPPANSSAQGAAPQQQQPGGKAPVTPAQGQPTASEIRKLKLKLEGQEVELPENEVIALAQRGKVSDKRFQEAATLTKKAEAVLKYAKENPAEFFKETGMNARQWAEQFLMEELKREQMSPEQRKAAENEVKLKQFEDEKKANEEKQRKDEMDKLQADHAQRYDTLFVEALTKSGLPKTKFTIKRMAELQLVNIKQKLELSADQLAKVVREDYISEQKALFGASEGEQLLDILGPEIAKKLAKAQLAKLKGKGLQTKSAGGSSKSKDAGMGGLSWKEYQRRNRRLT